MELSLTQLQALDDGQAVSVEFGGREYVVLARNVYDRVKGVLEDEVDGDALYDMIETVMAEDDANDPGLSSYQNYK
jgi:hypothetical protein